jgi:spermidine synthase
MRMLSGLRRRLAAGTGGLPAVTVSESAGIRTLHLGTPWVQGSMRVSKPYDIQLDYVQRMLGGLLFAPDADMAAGLPGWRALQLGLGAAALTKFSLMHLKLATTVVEINPQVLAVCINHFKLPAPHPLLDVRLGDAAQLVQAPDLQGRIDLLQVDLYDHEAAAPVLDSPAFYAACRHVLTPQGSLAVNLFGRAHSWPDSLAHIASAFGAEAVWAFNPTPEGNTVVLALRQPQTPERSTLAARADHIQARWPLPASKWPRVLHRPLVPRRAKPASE